MKTASSTRSQRRRSRGRRRRDRSRRARRSTSSSMPLGAMIRRRSGGSRLRAPTRATSARLRRHPRRSHPQRHPPGVAGRRALRRVRGRRARRSRGRRGGRARAARPPIAPTWAQQQPPRTSGRAGRLRALRGDLRPRASSPRSTAASGTAGRATRPRAISSPPAPHARGTRTSPAANSRPQLWHWYSAPTATAVSVRQSGQRARSASCRAPRRRSEDGLQARRSFEVRWPASRRKVAEVARQSPLVPAAEHEQALWPPKPNEFETPISISLAAAPRSGCSRGRTSGSGISWLIVGGRMPARARGS